MDIAYRAYSELLGTESKKEMHITYSGRFKDYNGNVAYGYDYLNFSLSKKWQDVSEEIVIGLLQTLILKTLSPKKRSLHEHNTFYINLYNDFIRNLSSYSDVKNDEPYLVESFHRVNDRLFGGIMDMPNLRWGRHSTSQLGYYTYANNTITLSRILLENEELLDFVMYHELLHKKHTFEHRGSRSYSHTPAFKLDEKKFSDKDMDKELRKFLHDRKKTVPPQRKERSLFSWFRR